MRITIDLTSRYGDKLSREDLQSLRDKVQSWAAQIVAENNSSNKHLGLHFTMSDPVITGFTKYL